MTDAMKTEQGPATNDERTLGVEDSALTVASALGHIDRLFTPTHAHTVGVEIEMFLQPEGVREPPAFGVAAAVSHELQDHLSGRLTFEPGGQIELSSNPAADLQSLADEVDCDLRRLAHGLGRVGLQATTRRDTDAPLPDRVLHNPRYDAMERYFLPWNPYGLEMMRATAALQVNVDVGATASEVADRWTLLYAIGPALVAAFGNSPSAAREGGWKSRRLRSWLGLDPARTATPTLDGRHAGPAGYAQWALDAPLMLTQMDGHDWLAPRDVSFRDWILRGTEVVDRRCPARLADLDLHLTTLFPFVRPKGYFEVRYLDMPPGHWWIVPTAVIHAVISGPRAADAARAICEGTEDLWRSAAHYGLQDRRLRRAAEELLELSIENLQETPGARRVAARIDRYRERWTSRGLSPADLCGASENWLFPQQP
ncbi:ergothioneine biosynthesis glutamate--cysteine ligase EgtA [Microbacterium rhizosphaerae]